MADVSASTTELKARARQVGEERDRVEAEIATISARLQAPGQPGLKGSLLDSQGFPRADIDIPRIAADRSRLAVLHNDHKRLSRDLEAAILAVHEAARLSRASAEAQPDAPHPTQTAPSPAAPAPAAPAEGSRAEAAAGPGAARPMPDAETRAQTEAQAERRPSDQAAGNGLMETEEEASCQGLPPFALIDEVAAGSPAEQDGLRPGDYLVAFGSVKGQTGTAAVAAVARELQESEGHTVRVSVLRAGRAQTLSVVPRTWAGRGLLGSHMVPL